MFSPTSSWQCFCLNVTFLSYSRDRVNATNWGLWYVIGQRRTLGTNESFPFSFSSLVTSIPAVLNSFCKKRGWPRWEMTTSNSAGWVATRAHMRRSAWVRSHPCSPAVWPWASHLLVGASTLIQKMVKGRVPTNRVVAKSQWVNIYKVLRTEPGTEWALHPNVNYYHLVSQNIGESCKLRLSLLYLGQKLVVLRGK